MELRHFGAEGGEAGEGGGRERRTHRLRVEKKSESKQQSS